MTVKEFKLPDLGEGLTDAEILRWFVAVGDTVEVDQPVVEVVTAKANVELPSPYAGTVSALHHSEGDVADVGSVLLSIDVAGAGVDVAGDGAAGNAVAGDGVGKGSSGSVLVGYGTRPERRRRRRQVVSQVDEASVERADGETAGPGGPVVRPAPDLAPASGRRQRPAVLSPVVRRLARELGVDLASLTGSRPDGVIVRADVERGVRGFAAAPPSPAVRSGSLTGTPAERIPIRGLHRQMAERLSRSRREIPEATVWVDVDATGLLKARDAIDAANPDRGFGVGVTSLLARICVLGLERFPILNSQLDGDEIVVGRAVNLGFAAQTDRGLIVPVVRHAEQLTLLELDSEIRRLAAAARAGTLTASEVTGGSFTVNNYGVFGVDGSAAIINHPEVAIVGIGRLLERPWVVDGTVMARPVTELTLAFDHRVCDGGVAGGFLRFVADCVEQPLQLLGRV